jgi:hypothetical protein
MAGLIWRVDLRNDRATAVARVWLQHLHDPAADIALLIRELGAGKAIAFGLGRDPLKLKSQENPEIDKVKTAENRGIGGMPS